MKKKNISIFKKPNVSLPPTEEEAEDKAYYAIQVYLDLIKNDSEKIKDFKDLVNDLIGDVRIKQKTNNKFDV